jgi:hypothetical protein
VGGVGLGQRCEGWWQKGFARDFGKGRQHAGISDPNGFQLGIHHGLALGGGSGRHHGHGFCPAAACRAMAESPDQVAMQRNASSAT